MKKLLTILLVMISAVSFGQTYIGKYLEAREGFKLRSYSVTHISNDSSGWNKRFTHLITEAAAHKFAKSYADSLFATLGGGGGGPESDPVWTADKPNYLTAAIAATTYSPVAHTHTFASLTSKPTTLAGYGITDAYPLAGNPSGFLTSFTESDPVYSGSSWPGTTNNSANWNTAFGWGNHGAAGYLTTGIAASTYEPIIAPGTSLQYWRGDKTWVTLDKAAVGLVNVDNTSDASKNSASVTLTNKTISGASNTISNISLASAVTGVLPVANGGTGTGTAGIGAINNLTGQTYIGFTGSENLMGSASPTTTGTFTAENIVTTGHIGAGITSPLTPFHVQAPDGGSGVRENVARFSVGGVTTDFIQISNGTAVDGSFIGAFQGITNTGSARQAMLFQAFTTSGNDAGTTPLVLISGYRTTSSTDPANGTLSAITTRPILRIGNNSASIMDFAANGNIGIGTTSPSATALVELSSTTKTFVVNKMNATQASALSSPQDASIIYVTTTNGTFTAIGFWGRENGTWIKL